MKKILVTCCSFLLLQSLPAQAERADGLKRLDIKSADVYLDNVSRNAVATGNVVITRGTTVLSSDRAEVKEAPDGYRTFILTVAPDLWTEGHAERIEYDERTDVIKLMSTAMLRQLEGQRVTHQMDQAFISYDNRNDVLLGRNDPSGTDIPAHGRGSISIEARRTGIATPR